MSRTTEEEALAIKEFTKEELAEFAEIYHGSGQAECMRVGPKGYVLYKEYKELASDIYNMPLRSDDIMVASFQRSGTTWTQELVYLLATNLNYEMAAKIPLTARYPFLEMPMFFDKKTVERMIQNSENPEQLRANFAGPSNKPTKTLADMPLGTPRFIKTHLPMSLLPPKLLDTVKVVYVARDPRDVIVSSFHQSKLFTMFSFEGEFRQMWNAFRKDLFLLTPYFEHVKEAWALRHHPNMLFVFYEELSKDLPGTINRIATFLGKEVKYTFKMRRLCEHLSFENFKKNKSVNNEGLRDTGIVNPKESFIRKGILRPVPIRPSQEGIKQETVVILLNDPEQYNIAIGKTGGWRDYFDEEMTKEAEQWIEENLRDTDLRFPSMEK